VKSSHRFAERMLSSRLTEHELAASPGDTEPSMSQDPPPASSSGTQDFYEFGLYRLDALNRSLYRSGVFVPLSPKVFDTLLVLVQEAGRVVTKDELMQKVWPDAFVEEGSIANNISTLRKLLNLDFDGEGPIATVPKRGYRFTAELRLRNPEGEIALRSPAAPAGQLQTVAASSSQVPSESVDLDELYSTPPSNRWKLPLLITSGVLIAAIAAYNLYFITRRHPISEKDTIVITDFTNKTGDAVFDDTLKQALIFDLEQSPRLNIITDRKVASTLLMMGRSAEDRVSGETARELCLRVGSKVMLTGTVSAIESEYLIGLQAINCATGDALVAEQARASGRGHVLSALDQAASRLREKLGESLSSVQKFSSPIDEFTTTSLEALKAYSIGRKITASGGDLPALPYLEKAITLDNNFAVAYSGLSLSYANLGQTTRSLAAGTRAYELRNHVSEHERFRIAGSYYLNVTGQYDEALSTFDMWAREYPRETAPVNNQGFCYVLYGQLENALDKTNAAVQLEPTSAALVGNLVPIQMALNKMDEAQNMASTALPYSPDSFVLRLPLYQISFLRENGSAMADQITWAEAHPADGAWLIDAQGDSAAYHGQFKSALAFYDRAVNSATQQDNSELAATWQAKVALIAAEFGDQAIARRYAAAALSAAPNRDVRTYLALAFARLGDTAQATKLISVLEKEFPVHTQLQKYWLPTTQAALALRANNPAEALRLLAPVASMDFALSFPLDYSTMYPTYLRGLAYLQTHQGPEAAAQFQKILDHPGAVINFPLASLSQLGLARATALAGDREKSRTAYNHFLQLWKDAEADISVLRQAKSEFTAVDSKTH
jgi:DNA-binding winged helix-turn-helix (wHTH) protein/tetratricopeptide (TPR) repeat protein